MNLELRNWYLSNLGIVQYLPRSEESVALPFHSSPVESVVGSGHDSGRGSSNGNPAVSSVKAQVASVLELMDVKTADSPAVEEKDSLPLNHDESTSATISPALNFRLACWHPCDDILVFNQLETGVQPDSDQCQLLSNILRAIGRLPKGLPPPELIDWPMGRGGGEGIDESESGAQTMLSVFLDARIKKQGVLWVLLMGERASELLSPVDKPYVDLLGSIEEISGGAKTVVIRSLQEMLQDSSTKLETWQAIQCLTNKN